MAYAKIVSKGVLVREKPFDGAKPLVNTPYEHRDGFRGVSEFIDNGEGIVEVWRYIELTDEEKPEPPADEALTRYSNELTGGNAENIQEATETLIKIVKEDK